MISYKTVDTLTGPLVFVRRTSHVGYQELVQITDANGRKMQGQVIALEEDTAVVQLFENPAGMQLQGAGAMFSGETKKVPLSPTILGRTFNGKGEPIDNQPQVEGKEVDVNVLPWKRENIYGAAINPYRRAKPRDFIQTGVSGLDLSNTLVKGQKLPIFSGSGLPDLELLTQIAAQAKTQDPNDKFTVVVAGMGISNDQYKYLQQKMEESGAITRSVMFINLAAEPVVERILTPRLALTVAEYLAYELGFSVLTLMFDLTNYANAMREISAAKNEIPGRSGYPGYLYTDLASLLERAGTVDGLPGSNTVLPVLSMPNDDKTHPVPDLTGYITEGQILLDREINKKGVYPPIDILGSLSRLKDAGQEATRDDHDKVADQMVAALAESERQKDLSAVLGRDSLSKTGLAYLEFNKQYFEKFLQQGQENRDIEETLNIAWELLSLLPREELKKVKPWMIEKYGNFPSKESSPQ
jgi:V/A-type H+-transporting ATPase subunit B